MNETWRGAGDATDALQEAVRNLPRDVPPEGLGATICRTLAELPLPERPPWPRLLAWMDRPTVVLSYRLATLALLVGILAGVWSLVAMRQRSAPPPLLGGVGPMQASREEPPPGGHRAKVTFVFYAPEAGSVAVVGSFNDWDPGAYPMTRDADGNWTVRVDLPPGQYEYQFVVDGSRFVPDPNATEQRDDGLGGSNAVLRL
jgi:hypothetical protein